MILKLKCLIISCFLSNYKIFSFFDDQDIFLVIDWFKFDWNRFNFNRFVFFSEFPFASVATAVWPNCSSSAVSGPNPPTPRRKIWPAAKTSVLNWWLADTGTLIMFVCLSVRPSVRSSVRLYFWNSESYTFERWRSSVVLLNATYKSLSPWSVKP